VTPRRRAGLAVMKPVILVVALAASLGMAALGVAALGSSVRHYTAKLGQPAYHPRAQAVPVPLGSAAPASGHGLQIGVRAAGAPPSWAPIASFATATGAHVSLALTYLDWGGGFQTTFARQAARHGATAVIQLQPRKVSLAAIAAGRYDGWLTKYATACRNYGKPVVIGFGHEMNGFWYSWGYGHQSAASFVAAWRHMVGVFRTTGATNVTWLWAVHHDGHAAALHRWWPGRKYVNWVGIDGYEETPGDNFSNMFGNSIRAVRKFTHAPVLLSETAVGPLTGQRAHDITRLFAGARRQHLLGLIWFDISQNNGVYHQDWRLEGDKKALAAFRQGVRASR
jgi:mannan endo-1,4-beta-mannosidase